MGNSTAEHRTKTRTQQGKQPYGLTCVSGVVLKTGAAWPSGEKDATVLWVFPHLDHSLLTLLQMSKVSDTGNEVTGGAQADRGGPTSR